MPPDSPSPTCIDVHAHALSPRLVELTTGHQGPPNPHNEHLMRTRYKAPFEDIDVRLETMERQGIDMQVVSHMPNFGYWADRQLSEQIVDAANTLIAGMCRDRPQRFVGLCLVSVQFPELAARQLEEAVRSGSTLGQRVAKYYLSNLIGNPLDTTIALSHLIFGGVLESHYLRRVWVDALVYQPENVEHIVRTLGASQVVVGTDYPFDMGEERPLGVLDGVSGLSDMDRSMIKGGNALHLLGMAE